MSSLCLALAVAFALWLDLCLGEPPARWHPVVWMGRYLGRMGQAIAPLQATGTDLAAFIKGALAWLAGAVVVGGTAWMLQQAGVSALRGMQPSLAGLSGLLAWLAVAVLVALVIGALLKTLLA